MLDNIRQIAIRAGDEILRFYGQEHPVDYKADDSPLTLADKGAHQLICAALRELTPDIPVVSEESAVPDYEERRKWERFWIVDPLDGTKEFIKQTGEFTVNIALVAGGIPELGVVYVPAQRLSYLAEKSTGAFKQTNDGDREPIQVRPVPQPATSDQQPATSPDRLTIVASRDHAGPQVKALLEAYPDAETRSMGSSLKFCLVAEGKADLYLRDVPTMEWDTAAAQCIVETAGGAVNVLDGGPLTYNKPDIRNPFLVTLGDPTFAWRNTGKVKA